MKVTDVFSWKPAKEICIEELEQVFREYFNGTYAGKYKVSMKTPDNAGKNVFDAKALTGDVRKLFLSISETAFGFTGVTKQMAEVQSLFPDAIAERPTIEDIMIANIGGYKK